MVMKRGRKSAGDRLTVVDATGGRVQPPDFLDDAELKEWHGIVDSLPADYFRAADVPLLAAFCTASSIYKECRDLIRRDGIVYENARGNICKNPASDIMAQQASAMAQMAIKLRLCPSSRYSDKKANTLHGDKAKKARPWDGNEEAEGAA